MSHLNCLLITNGLDLLLLGRGTNPLGGGSE
jgi:hypothetical protein